MWVTESWKLQPRFVERFSHLFQVHTVRQIKHNYVWSNGRRACNNRSDRSPFLFLEGLSWQLVLPYGVVNALITKPHSITHRQGFATKYRTEIPRDIPSDVVARNRKIGCKKLIISPLSFAKSYRLRDKHHALKDVGDNLQELALPLSVLAATAKGKEYWWRKGMREVCLGE